MVKEKSELSISSALERIGTTLTSSLELKEILAKTCQTAVETFGVDHSGIVLFDADLKQGKVESEYPAWQLVGKVIPLRDLPDEEKLIKTKKPLMVVDVANRKSLGLVRALLLQHKIQSILFVPVISKGRLLGSFSLDVSNAPRAFSDREIEFCRIFAERVAVAIENAQLYEDAKWQATHLEALRNTALAISSIADSDILLKTIVKQAAGLLKARSGGVYEYMPDRDELIVIADHNRPRQIGKVLKSGEGIAGRLVKTREPFMIVDDYNAWPGRADIYKNGRLFGSVIEVPLCWQNKIIGVLYIDDKVGRKFTPEDAYWLGLFADQATIALVNAKLTATDKKKVVQLEKLSRAITAIMSSIGRINLDTLLTLVAKNAVDILDAEVCGVHLVRNNGFLSLEAGYGHRKGSFKKGTEFAITSGPKTGLTGHIAYEGKIFSSYGHELINHFAVRGVKPVHLPSGKCYSLLAIPLRKKKGEGEELVGLLRIENKKKNGKALPAYRFSEEDEWILSIFAEAVVVAIQSAKLVDQLNEQKDHQARLFSSAPNCIIAIDTKGNVTDYNERAQKILGYSKREVLNKHVGRLYKDPNEPSRIGKQLHLAADGQLTNCETFIKAKSGEIIPIRLSATWLYNTKRQRIGSVGFFEDLRSTWEYEAATRRAQNLSAVLRVSRAVNSSIDFDLVLTIACKSIVELLKVDHSALVLFDGGFIKGEIKAEYPEIGTRGSIISIRGVPLEENLIIRKRPIVISDVANELALDPAREILANMNTRAVMLVPIINKKGRVIGSFGLDVWEIPREFTKEEIDLCQIFASQVAFAIENAQRAHNLDSVLRFSQTVNSSVDLDHILQEACQGAVHLLGVDHAGLVLFDEELEKGTVRAEYPKMGMEGDAFPLRGVPAEEELINFKRPMMVTDIVNEPGFDSVRDILVKLGTRSILIVPILSKGKVLGSFGLDAIKSRRAFTEEEIELCKIFAEQIAMAIENAKLFEERAKKLNEQEALAKLSQELLGTVTLQEALDRAVVVAANVLHSDFCDIVLLDDDGELIMRAAVGWKNDFLGIFKLGRNLESQSGYTIMTKSPVKVVDYAIEERFTVPSVISEYAIKSGMSVPIFRTGEVIGAMLVHTKTTHHFDEAEINLLSLIANQTAIAIQSAEHQANLLDAQEQLAAQSALDWMRIAGSTWAHGVTSSAIVIKENAETLRKLLSNRDLPEKIDEKLWLVEDQAEEILNMRITVPLSSETGIELIGVNAFLLERIPRICLQRGIDLQIDWNLKLHDSAVIKASREWFRRALDILVDNAIDAMDECQIKVLTISNELKGKNIEISILDTGKGIEEEKRNKLFREPLPSNKGMGTGLMLAAKIVRTFQGQIRLGSTGLAGTTMIISLPHQ